MVLDANLRVRLTEALRVVDDRGTAGPRLLDDAARLWARVQKLVVMGLIQLGDGGEREALELATYALQLPLRRPRPAASGRSGRSALPTLRDRCEEAAELLVTELGADIDAGLLDRTTRLLHELPHRSPMLDDARLLADALSLDDFGIVGIVQQIIQLAREGQGIAQLAAGLEKREQYGYWDARLKDGFHFEQVRQIAEARLQHARASARMLAGELSDDAL